METIKVKKVGKHEKFGEWLFVEDGSEKGAFRGTTPQVTGFLSKQVPCEVQVEAIESVGNRKNVITRVKILNKSDEEKLEETSPFVPASEYTSGVQESIVTQFCIREGIKLIEVFNSMSETKIKPTMSNVLTNAKIIRGVYDNLLQGEDFEEVPE